MRNRFFFIIVVTLILSALGITFVHVYFFKSQRLKLIDKQISEVSSLLILSEEFGQALGNPVLVEDAISNVLKGARIGKTFILRDSASNILYQSINSGLLDVDLPIQPEWLAVEAKDEFIRVKNIQLKGNKSLVLQVGLVLDRNFINWEIIDGRVVNYISGIVFTLFLASVLLTLLLLAPLRLLIAHLKEETSNLVNLKDVRPLPAPLLRFTQGQWRKSDEFSDLLIAIHKLIDRINLNYKLTRSWTFQMAHELKTPLAIIRAETESNQKANNIPKKYAHDLIKEVQVMSDTISQFLEWAELENSQLQRDLNALHIKAAVKSCSARLTKVGSGRIQLLLNSDFLVIANPAHLDQLISNLITNALKFSPESKPVEITLADHFLLVRDYGPGIPREVKERMGQPFNVGSYEEGKLVGSGLGLAWVITIAKLYNWKFEIDNSNSGTAIIVRFPKEESLD